MPWIVSPTTGDQSFPHFGDEQKNNVNMIARILNLELGWSLNAVAGICGCLQGESRFNPWAWQGNRIQPVSIKNEDNPRGRAYGLPQWDSCLNYINNPQAQSFPGYGPNFSDQEGSQDDGTAQCYFINTGFNYYPTSYCPLKFAEFIISEESPGYLARSWVRNYERPASGGTPGTDQKVTERADFWWEFLTNTPPGPDPKPIKRKSKWWIYMRRPM